MKQQKYRHIKKAERLEIAILLGKNYSIRDIAKALNRSPGTISEEISSNSVNGIYDPHKADHKSYVKRKYSKYQGMKVVQNKELRNYVEEKIKEEWSPEQISGRIKNKDKHIKYVGFKGIYKFIQSPYGRQIEKYLRYGGKKNKQNHCQSASIKNRSFIDERPEIADNRARFGDWEGDLIVSPKTGKGILLILHERKSRYPIIEKILSRKTDEINNRINQRIGGFACFNSLTVDNDISFSGHRELSKMISAPVYFCHAYHSWEKGGVENTNKLIRQYVPKGTDISRLKDEYVEEIEMKLQNRPRKCLNYKTPFEVMKENNQFKTSMFSDKISLDFEVNKNSRVFGLRG